MLDPYPSILCYGAIPYGQTPENHSNTVAVSLKNTVTDEVYTGTAFLKAVSHVPSLKVTKLINGADTTQAPGVYLQANTPASITAEIVNDGDVPVTDIAISDSANLPFVCLDTSLQPGNSTTCTAELPGLADDTQHSNTVTVTANAQLLTGSVKPLSVSDTAWAYTATTPGVTIKKMLNGVESPDPLKPQEIGPGVPANFTVEVANIGNAPIRKTNLQDDAVTYFFYNDIGGDGILSPGEVWIYYANLPGFPENTTHSNTAIFTGDAILGDITTPIEESAQLYAFTSTANPQLDLVKEIWGKVDGVEGWYDANAEPGVEIVPLTQCNPEEPPLATPQTCFRFVTTNTGNTYFYDVTIEDDRVTPNCNINYVGPKAMSPAQPAVVPLGGVSQMMPLPPGGSHTCYGALDFTATELNHKNTATVLAREPIFDPSQPPVVVASDTDVAYGYKALPLERGMTFRKLISGQDADDKANAVVLNDGDVPNVTFVVSNTGTAPITNFTIADNIIDSSMIDCPSTGQGGDLFVEGRCFATYGLR